MGPLDRQFETWSHAELWFPEYKGHSYIRIRDLATGAIVSNISTSIGFGFGAYQLEQVSGGIAHQRAAEKRAERGSRTGQ